MLEIESEFPTYSNEVSLYLARGRGLRVGDLSSDWDNSDPDLLYKAILKVGEVQPLIGIKSKPNHPNHAETQAAGVL